MLSGVDIGEPIGRPERPAKDWGAAGEWRRARAVGRDGLPESGQPLDVACGTTDPPRGCVRRQLGEATQGRALHLFCFQLNFKPFVTTPSEFVPFRNSNMLKSTLIS